MSGNSARSSPRRMLGYVQARTWHAAYVEMPDSTKKGANAGHGGLLNYRYLPASLASVGFALSSHGAAGTTAQVRDRYRIGAKGYSGKHASSLDEGQG